MGKRKALGQITRADLSRPLDDDELYDFVQVVWEGTQKLHVHAKRRFPARYEGSHEPLLWSLGVGKSIVHSFTFEQGSLWFRFNVVDLIGLFAQAQTLLPEQRIDWTLTVDELCVRYDKLTGVLLGFFSWLQQALGTKAFKLEILDMTRPAKIEMTNKDFLVALLATMPEADRAVLIADVVKPMFQTIFRENRKALIEGIVYFLARKLADELNENADFAAALHAEITAQVTAIATAAAESLKEKAIDALRRRLLAV